jgi:4-hydroxy-tetrahydrodipicolinate synthase
MRGITQNCSSFQKRIKGKIIPAVPVPMDSRGKIHWPAHEKYVAWMAKQPIAGVAIWVHTGRGLFLTPQQRKDVFNSWRNGLKKNQVIVTGVGALKTSKNITKDSFRMGEEAAELGADAFLTYAPVGFRGARDQDKKILAHHKELAKLNIPIVLFYLYEAAGGISYSLPLLSKLFSIPQVAGIKMATLDSVMTYQDVSNLILEKFPRQMLITGEDRMLGYTFMRGARSALIGMGAACTKLQANLLTAHIKRDSASFLRLSNQVDAFAEATFIKPMEGYILRMLWALALAKIIPFEACHDHWGPKVNPKDLDYLKKVMRKIGQL